MTRNKRRLAFINSLGFGLICAMVLTGCKEKTASEDKNFRASKGWFFAKEHAALLFVPFSKVSQISVEENDLQFCSYYVKGDTAIEGKYSYLDLRNATERSPSPFSIDALFLGMMESAKTDERMALLTLNWARGSASLAGDFLELHKGKIESTVVATAVAAAAVTVTCTLVMKSSPKNCSQILPSLTKYLKPENIQVIGEGLTRAKELSPLPRSILSSRKLKGLTSFLTFALSFLPGQWANWVSEESSTNEYEQRNQMEQLLETLGSEGVQARAEQRLESILASSVKVPEEVHWSDLQTITGISMSAGKRTLNTHSPSTEAGSASTGDKNELRSAAEVPQSCPRPSELNPKTIKEYFQLESGWAKGV